jgi:hypothetical protein
MSQFTQCQAGNPKLSLKLEKLGCCQYCISDFGEHSWWNLTDKFRRKIRKLLIPETLQSIPYHNVFGYSPWDTLQKMEPGIWLKLCQKKSIP